MNKLLDEIVNPFSAEIKYTSLPEHAVQILKKKWQRVIITGIAVFGVIWTFVESGNYFFHLDLSGKYYYLLLIIISLLSAFIYSTLSYLKTPPDGLEKLPHHMQRIAILKKPFWEYRFAYVLLNDKLAEIDNHLLGVLNGQVYIEISKKPKISEYIDWIQLRPKNLINMIDIANKLLVFELPASLAATKETKIFYKNVLECIERIKDLYQKTCDYEIEGREITPPEGFDKIHEIQSGWSKVIRDGIKQILKFLEKISNLDKKKLKDPIKFTIMFNEPEGINEFESELNNIKNNVPSLFLNEMFPSILNSNLK